MKKSLLFLAAFAMTTAAANDSTGYVAMNGVNYIKNDKITMQKEDLYISKNLIKVDYEFKNLTNKPITETVLFPLPIVPVIVDSDYADIQGTINSFKTIVNGRAVNYKTHARAFMYAHKNDKTDYDNPIDVTKEFQSCGVAQHDILKVWSDKETLAKINKKVGNCDNPTLKKLMGEVDVTLAPEWAIEWEGQVIYEFNQTFAPNAITKISHRYAPLVGGSVQLVSFEYPQFCVDKSTQATLKKHLSLPYSAVGYILTTGANWAKPIERFSLTVERDKGELVSFCWDGKGKVQKVGDGKFKVTETNFIPKHDLDIAFIKLNGH